MSETQTRTIDDILGGALEELYEREAKIDKLLVPLQRELGEVRTAIKKLEKATAKPPARASSPATNGSGGGLGPAEKRAKVRAVLDDAADEDPLTLEGIANRAGIARNGLNTMLAAMKRNGEIAEPEEGLWLSTKAPRFDTQRRDGNPNPEAALAD